MNLAIECVNQESTLPNAIRLFTLAAEAKHPLAQWYLAQLHQAGIGLNPSCQVAVSVNVIFLYITSGKRKERVLI